MTNKIQQIQSNFTAGEITPRLWAHVDIAKYKNAVKTAENCIVLPHGPLRRRNGFEQIEATKDSAKVSRLLRFQFDQDNAYILEFGDLYIRFYKDGGQISSGGVPYTVVTTYTQTEVKDITYVQFGRILYLFHGSHAPAQLTWTSDAVWALTTTSFYPSASSEEGYKPTGTVTPAAVSGTGINFTASGIFFEASDVGRQIHNLAGTGKASITSFTSNYIVVCTILQAFPSTAAIAQNNWKVDLSPIVSITPSASREGSMVNLTAAANTWISTPRDVGKYVLLHNGVVLVTSLVSNVLAIGEIQKALDAVTATSNWTQEESIWSSVYGYPSVGTLHQQRLFAAGTSHDPQTIWASESGIFDSMGIGSRDGDSLSFELSGTEVNKISWAATIRGQLVFGTTGAEVTIDGGSSSNALTPSNITQQVRGYHGSNLQQPVALDDQVIYVQRSGRKISAFRYDFQIDNYVSEDLLFLAEHLSEAGIKEIAYAQDPDRILFVVLNDGDMLACTYIREQEVTAWTKWTTDGLFESVQTISTGGNDEVWVIVKRTINGATKRYVERLDYSTGEDNIDGFSDSYLSYSLPKTVTAITKASTGVVTAAAHGFSNGDLVKMIEVGGMTEVIGLVYKVANKTTNTFELNTEGGVAVATTSYTTYTTGGEVHKLVTTISGLSHLEGKVVQVKTDGATHTNKTVSSGAITLDRRAYEVTVGLPYTTTIVTLPREYSLGVGSQQGQQARWVKPVLRFHKSALPSVNTEEVPVRDPQDKMNSSLGLFTGDVKYGNLTWKEGFNSNLTISFSGPLPMTLLGIFGSIEGGTE